MVDIHLRKLLWVYCPVHAGVKGNRKEQIDWRAKQPPEGQKAKDITPLIAWRREALKD